MNQDKVRVPDIARMKDARQAIAMLTAYDFPFARMLDRAGVDVLLVGDSLGNVMHGLETTIPVTLEMMIVAGKAVRVAAAAALDVPVTGQANAVLPAI